MYASNPAKQYSQFRWKALRTRFARSSARIEASERIVKALRDRGREVTFVVYPDEGHGFQRIENQRDFSARVEEFLAKHLGGRAIPRVMVAGTSAELR